MARLLTAQPTFTTLVANIEGAGDPSKGRNPVKVRTGFTSQHICEVPRGSVAPERVPDPRTPGLHTHEGLLTWTTPGVPVGATGSILVADNTFTSAAVLYLGDFTVTSGVDFTVGGSTALTATALAAAIQALPGFSASAALSTVSVTGPFGPDGNEVRCSATYQGSVQNYTITPVTGFLSGAEPYLGPPVLLP